MTVSGRSFTARSGPYLGQNEECGRRKALLGTNKPFRAILVKCVREEQDKRWHLLVAMDRMRLGIIFECNDDRLGRKNGHITA